MPIEICAEMDAVVRQVLCAVGDVVNDGDTVVVLESMKMEIPVVVPGAGRITSIAVGPGDVVADGSVVAVLSET